METRKRDRQRAYRKPDFNGVFLLRLSLLAFYREPKSLLDRIENERFLFLFNVSFAFPSLSSSFTLDLATLLSSLNVSPPFCSSVVRLFRFFFSLRPRLISLDLTVSLVLRFFEREIRE